MNSTWSRVEAQHGTQICELQKDSLQNSLWRLKGTIFAGLIALLTSGDTFAQQTSKEGVAQRRDELANERSDEKSDAEADGDLKEEDPEAAQQRAQLSIDRTKPLLGVSSLTPADVVASVYRSYPLILSAQAEAGVASGKNQSAQGWWDPKLEGYSLNQPLGFYRNYRQGIGLARNLWWGGYLSTGYRLGRGEIQPWYKERETDEGGEFKIGWMQPLLQGFELDPNRVALFQSQLHQQQVAPAVQLEVLQGSQEGFIAYWAWVTSGLQVKTQEELLRLATIRVQQIEKLIAAGDEEEASVIFNEQLIAERKSKLLDTIRKLRETGFKLSIYLRDEQGKCVVPDDAWLPMRFPPVGNAEVLDFDTSLSEALSRRPELEIIDLLESSSQWDLRLARNQLLPELDLLIENSQDVGDPASSLRDKSRFETEIGIQGSVPLPRNKARGKIQETQAKLNQIAFKRQLQSDKIQAELRRALNALSIASQRAKESEVAVRSAMRFLELAERGYLLGEFDLVDLNILESKAYEARFLLLATFQEWFVALSDLQAAMGVDPLEQAMTLSEQLLTMPPIASPLSPTP